ncbi:MAG: hypothetical protein AAFN77_05370 [Planctomycetota bacterium]
MTTPIMTAPEKGVKVRMYRQGHGDCFLLAFRQTDGSPFYLLIDFGLKAGSELKFQKGSKTVKHDYNEIAQHISDSTGGHLHLVVVTHEHEDHVSGFRRAGDIFKKMKIDRLWLAWTEDPKNELANSLRKKYKDTLLGLFAVGQQLQAASTPEDERLRDVIHDVLGFETEDGELPFGADAKKKIKGINNKIAIKLIKERADKRDGTDYLTPNEKQPQVLANVDGVRVYVLGPPENEALLKNMDPKGNEEFHLAATFGQERSLFAAASAHAARSGMGDADKEEVESNQPFAAKHRIPFKKATARKYEGFFKRHYFDSKSKWRTINHDWMRAAEQFAIRMSSYVNNTSLVLAFEFADSGNVLLFVGDAQRGNWVSWKNQDWEDKDGETIAVNDLLARTVFYKVGHHGSHNATLNEGGLAEMAKGKYAKHFVAMIPSHEKWAKEKKKWEHPLAEIRAALYRKTRGRLLQTDRSRIRKPNASTNLISTTEWNRFKNNVEMNELYFELTIK